MTEPIIPRRASGDADTLHNRPPPWKAFRSTISKRWAIPFLYADWLLRWSVYAMSRMAFFEFLEYCGSLSILVAVIFYFAESPERTKLKHYQAWQVINSAQDKGGNGGRIDALQELNDDHISLLGVDVNRAFLQGIKLRKANLNRANLSAADMRDANLSKTSLQFATLKSTNLVNANLTGADVDHADFQGADLTNADLKDLKNWQHIDSMDDTSIGGVRNAPLGFIDWAKKHGATEDETNHGRSQPAINPSSRPAKP